MRTFPTDFSFSVTRLEAEGTGCAYMSGSDTLPGALALAFKYATFYAGPRGALVVIYEQCRACKGNGFGPRHPKSGKRTKCGACRGEPEVSRLGFQALPHGDCTIFRGDELIFGSLDPARKAVGT